MGSDQTWCIISVRQAKGLIRFGDLGPIFKVTTGLKLSKSALSVLHPDNCLHGKVNWIGTRSDTFFCELGPIVKVLGDTKYLQISHHP